MALRKETGRRTVKVLISQLRINFFTRAASKWPDRFPPAPQQQDGFVGEQKQGAKGSRRPACRFVLVVVLVLVLELPLAGFDFDYEDEDDEDDYLIPVGESADGAGETPALLLAGFDSQKSSRRRGLQRDPLQARRDPRKLAGSKQHAGLAVLNRQLTL